MITCMTTITAVPLEECDQPATVEMVDFFDDGELPETYRFCDEHRPTRTTPEHPVVAYTVIRYLRQGL